MTPDTPDAILLHAARHGALDSAHWPSTLQYLLDRLDEIVATFPKPPPTSPPSPDPLSSQESTTTIGTTTNKENARPHSPPRSPVPAAAVRCECQAAQDMAAFYAATRKALTSNFSSHPPHTIQRLAELVLEPKRPYRHLPSYLRALDRVVSVSSPLTVFPLPQAVLPTSSSVLNGISSTTPQSAALGSDESLGGALLTPIPWLQNRGQNELISESTEMVDGPNGAGTIETVTVGMLSAGQRTDTPTLPLSRIASSHPDGETLPSTGPVTQGELLRQEQEAGIVVSNPHALTAALVRSNFVGREPGEKIVETVEADEVPHARGPEIIGLEDTGLQKQGQDLDIEGAVGRPSVEQTDSASSSRSGPAAQGSTGEDAEAAAGRNEPEVKDQKGVKEGEQRSELESYGAE